LGFIVQYGLERNVKNLLGINIGWPAWVTKDGEIFVKVDSSKQIKINMTVTDTSFIAMLEVNFVIPLIE
jgi:hypothetical protein